MMCGRAYHTLCQQQSLRVSGQFDVWAWRSAQHKCLKVVVICMVFYLAKLVMMVLAVVKL
jgi:hypothetical protein